MTSSQGEKPAPGETWIRKELDEYSDFTLVLLQSPAGARLSELQQCFVRAKESVNVLPKESGAERGGKRVEGKSGGINKRFQHKYIRSIIV